MERIQFTQVKCSSGAERIRIKACKMLLSPKLKEDRLSGTLDVCVMSEAIVAFADIHGAKLTGPLIDIAKQVSVNLPQVCEIELAHQRRQRKLLRSEGDQVRFGLFQQSPIADSKPILQYACPGINILVTS